MAVVGEDPSNAATVTDTPLSAFAPELFQPKVDSGPPRQEIIERPAGRNGASPPVGASLQRETASETTPHRSSPRPAPSHGSHAQSGRTVTARAPSDLEDTSRGDGKGKVIAAAALVVLVFAVLVFGAIMMRGPSVNYDQQLTEYFERGDYAGVEKLYVEHQTQFTDLKKALALRDAAHQKLSEAAAPPPPPPTEVAPKPADLGEPPPGEEPADEEEPPAKSGAKATPHPSPSKAHSQDAAAAQKKSAAMARAAGYEIEGRKRLLAGDLGAAERYLKLCLQTVETYAACHRQLGVLYASKEDTRAAIQHYKRYIELDPNAIDAERVKQLIQDATRK
jgi:hypothetical protein